MSYCKGHGQSYVMECRIVKVMVRVMSWNVVLQRPWSELCHGMSYCKGHGQSYVMECRIVKIMAKVMSWNVVL